MPHSYMAQHGISHQEAMEALELIGSLRIGVAGENIIDEYIWVQAAGRSMKSSIVTFRETGRERWLGGSCILAKHLLALAAEVKVITPALWPIRKQRWVEKPFIHKVFSAVASDIPVKWRLEPADVDMVIAADFGHGMFDKPVDFGLPLALTVQSNSLNWGYNMATKWRQAQYLVIDEDELRLAAGQQYGENLPGMMEAVMGRMDIEAMSVTLGHRGCLMRHCSGEIVSCPSLVGSGAVLDRMGAGDAFLSITAPLVFYGVRLPVVALLGNLAGAFEVGQIGNVPLDIDYIKRRLTCPEL